MEQLRNKRMPMLIFLAALILFASQSVGAVTENTLYMETNSSLYTLDSNTGAASLIGDTFANLTDIAFSGSMLYGVSFSSFYSVDPDTGESTLVGRTGNTGVNALEVANDGTIYAADFLTSELLTIDPTTGAGTIVGSLGTDVFSTLR